MTPAPHAESQTTASTAGPKPSRKWYALAAVLFVGSAGVFATSLINKWHVVRDQIDPMPRFVGPTGEAGFVFTAATPGKYNIFYENRGTLEDRSFDTPRRQIWTNFDAPSMTCLVERMDDAKAAEVRLPGVGEINDKRVITKDLVYAYDLPGRQGHSAWVFEADQPGDYRIVLNYIDAVRVDPGDIDIPAELSKAEQKQMTTAQGEAYEAIRRDAIENASLAELEPVDVLFAVGPDPTRGGFFELLGLKGAATLLAFGFTFSVLIALVTLMLRGGHVTPRGELSAVKRMGESIRESN